MGRPSVYALLILAAASLNLGVSPVGANRLSDYFDYTAADPDTSRWEGCGTGYDPCQSGSPPLQEHCDADPDDCFQMSVSNPPGYLYAENLACNDFWDVIGSGTSVPCGYDAAIFSKTGLIFDAGKGTTVTASNKFSPDVHNNSNLGVCNAFNKEIVEEKHREFHVLGLYDGASFSNVAELLIMFHCYKYQDEELPTYYWYAKITYTPPSGPIEYFKWLTCEPSWCRDNAVGVANDWLTLRVEVRDGGQTTFSLQNQRTGDSWSRTVSTKLGTYDATIKMEARYHHNHKSRTDYIQLDWVDSFNTAYPIAPGSYSGYLSSIYDPQDLSDWYRFSVSGVDSTHPKTVTVTVNPPSDTALWIEIYKPSGSLWSGSYASAGVTNSHTSTLCSSGEWRIKIFIGSFGDPPVLGPGGLYTFSVSLTSGGSCGGGGSVQAGTMITLADRSQMPVQDVLPGMRLLSYDPMPGRFFRATVTQVVIVSVDNMYVVETDRGRPIRVDYYEQFWVRLPGGQTLWMLAGEIQFGYQIYRPLEGVWATVTSNTRNDGTYIVYDLIITPTLQDPPGMMPLIANGYLDAKVP